MDIRSPFDELMGAEIVEVGAERVVAELAVTPSLHQPGGIVHGGAYCALVELTASVGANTWLAGDSLAVGANNHTDFLRPVRSGRLRAEATPLQRGQRLQLWQVDVTDEDGRRVAHGKVKLVNVNA